ncbi:hypothetical protein ELQ35_03620 [Peribacillus cavernae]|uniref:Uncharacterized protein n=1 Tax=Peribacillus cavernae TaxID=1674310 RepID=A0A433HT03_9BACI|nr:hypothetical protein [Peribacillus cavernae]MDQ0218448.1 hypothetical protein [Peribacillus cavernae]RUQ31448.1 hypothetical protein ELQ35_03620 [Peribacillus cavernae]
MMTNKNHITILISTTFIIMLLILLPGQKSAEARVIETPFYTNSKWLNEPVIYTDPSGNVYANESGDLEAISWAGKKKWRYATPYREISNVTFDKAGNIYADSWYFIHSITNTGKVRWVYNHHREGISKPIITNAGNVLFSETGNGNDPDPDNWYSDYKTVTLNSTTGKKISETAKINQIEGKDNNYYKLDNGKIESTTKAGKIRWTYPGKFSEITQGRGNNLLLREENINKRHYFRIVNIGYDGKVIGKTPEMYGIEVNTFLTVGAGTFFINNQENKMITSYFNNGKKKWHKGYSPGYMEGLLTVQNNQLYLREQRQDHKYYKYKKLSLIDSYGKTKWSYSGNNVTLPVADSKGNVYVGRDITKIFKVK